MILEAFPAAGSRPSLPYDTRSRRTDASELAPDGPPVTLPELEEGAIAFSATLLGSPPGGGPRSPLRAPVVTAAICESSPPPSSEPLSMRGDHVEMFLRGELPSDVIPVRSPGKKH